MAPSRRTESGSGPSPTPPISSGESTLHVSRSADRAMRLLDIVVSRGSMTLGDAAVATDLTPSTALRHLRALCGSGYLRRDEVGRYCAGPSMLRLALHAFRSGPYARLSAATQPLLELLVEVTGESAYLAVRDGTMAVYIASVESPRAIRHVGWVGSSVPIAGTAIGEALIAAPLLPGERPLPAVNTGAIEADVTGVAAPIHGPTGVLGAFSVLGPADRLAGDRLARASTAVIEAAMVASDRLSPPVGGSGSTS